MTVHISPPPADALGARVDIRSLRSRAVRILRGLRKSRSELSVALVDDPSIAQLNARYRNRRGATDVLSFSLIEGEHAGHRGKLLGDVVISVETAARAARERHLGLDDEVARLLVHGVLHLLGHDHVDDQDAKRMRAEERRLWQLIEG